MSGSFYLLHDTINVESTSPLYTSAQHDNRSASTVHQDGLHTGWSVFSMLLLMLSIICANALMCVAIHKAPTPRFVTNLLTLNLGVCDLGVALLCIPMSLGVMTSANGSDVPRGFCNFLAFLTVTLLLVSVGTLAAISLDRYFSICHALRYPIEMTGRRGYCVLAFIWTESLVFAALPLFGWGEYKADGLPMCLPQWSSSVSNAVVTMLLGITLPFCSMLYAYSCIIQEARKQAQRIVKLHLTPSCDTMVTYTDKDHLVPSGRRLSVLPSKWRRPSATSSVSAVQYSTTSHNLKTLSTVFIIVGTFIVCWCPYIAVSIWAVLHGGAHSLSYVVHFAVIVLLLSSCVFNPCVFMLLTRDLRHTVFHLLLRIVFMCRKQQQAQSSAALCGAYCSRRTSGMMGDTINRYSRESRASMDSGVDIELLQRQSAAAQNSSNGSQQQQQRRQSAETGNSLAPPLVPHGRGQIARSYQSADSTMSPPHQPPPPPPPHVVTPKFLTIPTIVVQGQTN